MKVSETEEQESGAVIYQPINIYTTIYGNLCY